jgi:LysR family nitrogen assimilation transcriptional regulator
MDFRDLTYVTTAIRLESITKAAAELNVAQPALSRKIRMLEEELGVTLLVRHRRGVKATEEGLRFVNSAETLLQLMQQLREEARSYATEPSGQIRFGFLPAVGDLFAGQVIADFIRRYPQVTFLLREGLTADLSEALLAGRLDIAIMIYEEKHQDLHRQPLFSEDVWLAGAPSIWPFGKGPLRLEQLEGLPLVHAAIVGRTLEKLASVHRLKFRAVIEGGTRTAARAAVRAGAGFTLMPASWVVSEIEEGYLAGAPVDGLEVQRGLFWRADRPLSRAVVEFVNEIVTTVNALRTDKPELVREIAGAPPPRPQRKPSNRR